MTETDWVFYKFGPYSYEIEESIKDFPIEKVSLKDGQLFEKLIPKECEKKIVWSDEGLEKLRQVGERLRRALGRMPSPEEPEYPGDTAEMLAI